MGDGENGSTQRIISIRKRNRCATGDRPRLDARGWCWDAGQRHDHGVLEGRRRRGEGADRGHVDEDATVDERKRGRAEKMGGSPR